MERINYIDMTKGILITLMVWTHISTWGTHFFNFVFSFHMAAFFIISGYFASDKLYSLNSMDFILDRIKKYIKPYFFFCILGALIHIFWGEFQFLNQKMFETTFLYMQPDWLYFGAGWFLWALLWGNIGLFFWIKYVEMRFDNKDIKKLLLFFLLILLAVNILRILNNYGCERMFLKFDSGLMATVFCIIGFYIKKWNLLTINKHPFTDGGVLLIVLLFLAYYYTGNIANCFYVNGFVYIFTGIIGFYAIILLAYTLQSLYYINSFFKAVGKYFMPIFAMHGILLSGLATFFQIPVGKNVSIMIGLLYTIFVIFMLILIILVYDKILRKCLRI